MLGFGVLIFFSIIIILSSFIWSIEIVGNETYSNEVIMELLADENIKSGIIKYNIDKNYIRSILLNELDCLSFVSVDIKGTRLIITIYEQDIPP